MSKEVYTMIYTVPREFITNMVQQPDGMFTATMEVRHVPCLYINPDGLTDVYVWMQGQETKQLVNRTSLYGDYWLQRGDELDSRWGRFKVLQFEWWPEQKEILVELGSLNVQGIGQTLPLKEVILTMKLL